MKKILNYIIVIASFLLLIALGLFAVNDAVHFMDVSKYQGFIDFLRNYGALIIVGALVFVNLIAKSIIRIAFLILFLLAFALYILGTSFPGIFAAI